MPLLRLTQNTLGNNLHRVEIRFENEPPIPIEFEFQLSNQDYGRIRWYLEEFLKYPMDPAPKMAKGVEKRIREIGIDLYEKIFSSRDAIKLWGRLQAAKLSNVKVEILTSVEDAVNIPWELLCDPDTDSPLALEAQSFVRAPVSPARLPIIPQTQPEKVRILLVICRPGGDEDVPFRSVAGKLLKGLDESAWERLDLDVLRPPTFAQLAKVLRNAKAEGKPYHIVHFDGHGAYLKVRDAKIAAGALKGQMPLVMQGSDNGASGFLLFKNPQSDENIELVDGTSLGNLLYETEVTALVLNACRSAHAEIQEQPNEQEGIETHAQVRAFGSLAQEVMDAGVVAMRYNVYVVTAAQFVADLYAALASGQTLGEAASMGRKQLASPPQSENAPDLGE